VSGAAIWTVGVAVTWQQGLQHAALVVGTLGIMCCIASVMASIIWLCLLALTAGRYPWPGGS
jgi:hypothetical protein